MPATAALLAPTVEGHPVVRIAIETDERPMTTQTLIFDVPGECDEWVVLSAHVDGHDLAESAIDNASGLAAALAVARALAPTVARSRRGLRLAFFSVEEWALTGSARYVAGLSAAARAAIALNVNLDSVGGSPHLSALTSGFAGVESFLRRAAQEVGHELRCVRPLMVNSDHANFAQAGIPAFRLVAGFDDPAAWTRLVLTHGDTRDKVTVSELLGASTVAGSIIANALEVSDEEALRWRQL